MINMLTIGKKALMTAQYSLDTTSQNIANANTPGYSRQRTIQQADTPISNAHNYLGTGVSVQKITRMRDTAIDTQYRQENSQLAYWQQLADSLTGIEGELFEPSDYGLSAQMDAFFDSWQDVCANPSGSVGLIMREGLILTAQTMCQEFSRLDTMLDTKAQQADLQLQAGIDDANTIIKEMADLNSEIQQSQWTGKDANDLNDRFDQLLDELSAYGEVRLVNSDNGTRKVYFGSDEVVSYDQYRLLDVQNDKLIWQDNGQAVNGLQSGKINSLLTLKTEYIPTYNSYIDTLAVDLATKVNNLHSQAYSIGDPPTTGANFFDNVTGAGDIRVNQYVADNSELVSISANGAEGDNSIGLKIVELREADTMDADSLTFNNYYGKFLNRIGNDSANAANRTTVYENTTAQVDSLRENIKGVSVDEETAELLKYQRAYQAAAKVISLADEIMQTIISMV